MLQFADFEFDERAGEVRRNAETKRLEPQPARVLGVLLERAGEVVTRAELQQRVWSGDTFVDFDRGLNYCIAQIREALGDSAAEPRFIETLPRRGYRFIAPVQDGLKTVPDNSSGVAANEKSSASIERAVGDEVQPVPPVPSIPPAKNVPPVVVLSVIAVVVAVIAVA